MPQTVKCRGCKGRSPLHKITLVSPFPAGEERSASAGRGDILPLRGRGAESKTKGRAGRRPKRQAAHANITAAVSTGNAGGKPSPGACFSGSASAASGSVPGYLHGRVCKCRKRSNAGVPGAVAPGKIILESPPSPPGKSALRARVGGISFPFGEGGQNQN